MKNKYLERTLEFHKIYQDEILPILRREEPNRKLFINKIIKYWTLVSILVILTVVFLWFWINYTEQRSPILPILSVITLAAASILIYFPFYRISNFTESIKKRCLSKILRVFGDITCVSGTECIKKEDLFVSALFPKYDTREDDDEFIGTYNGVDFKISETELFKIYRTKNGENRKSVFKGVILSFDANKTIKNRTMVATKGDLTLKNSYFLAILPIFSTLVRIILEFDKLNPIYILIALILSLPIAWGLAYLFREKEKEKLDEVILEDSRFCKKFNVYSSDQVEARYLITTAFMERLQNLKTAFGAKKVKCSFFGNQIMFAISTKKNLFEIAKINIPLTDPKTINECYNELSAIYKMISYFKLDKKTGL